MANVNHATLTDPNLHEPKGIAAAPAGQVYIADGAGSGDWKELSRYVNGYVAFDAATPAYQHSVTTSFTAIDPTFAISSNNGFTGLASPNARLRYDGSETITAFVQFTIAFKNNSGTDRDLEVEIYKNGSSFNGAHTIVTAISGTWASMTLPDVGSLSTNDYLEIFVKGSAAFTLDIASASLTVTGVPV
jgi:hypothetical protein